MVTSIGFVWMSSRILRRILSVTLSSSLERKSAAVLTDPAMCAILKLNCNTYSYAFQSAGGIGFVWKKRVNDLLSDRTIVGFVASHRMCANSKSAMYFAKNFFEYMDVLIYAVEKIFEPNATGAYFFRFECIF